METAKINLIATLKNRGDSELATSVLELLEEREKQIKQVSDECDEYKKRYETLRLAVDHVMNLEQEHFKEVKEAFPHGDFVAHRNYHENLIKSAEAQEQFWTSLRNEMIRKGVWFGLIAVLGLILIGLQLKFKGWLGI